MVNAGGSYPSFVGSIPTSYGALFLFSKMPTATQHDSDSNYNYLVTMMASCERPVQTGYNLSSRNLIWDTGRVGLVVSHNSVNDGNHLPAGMAHGRHVGLPFIPFFLEIKLQRRIVKYC